MEERLLDEEITMTAETIDELTNGKGEDECPTPTAD